MQLSSLLFLSILSTIISHALTQSDSSSYTSDSSFQSAILNSTNFYRKRYNASSLTWNDTLATYATSHAEDCNFAHTGGPYGENLAAGYANATASIEAWGNEGRNYDFAAAQFDASTGHFTQLVWKATTSTGCGRMNCSGENGTPGWFVICEYYPQGNVIGNFSQNVQEAVAGNSAAGGNTSSTASSASIALVVKLWMLILCVGFGAGYSVL